MAKYFTLKELVESETATAKGIDNFPSFEIAAHLQELTETILDPLREAWGGPLVINSGYRCEALNRAVGGSATSAHMFGYAADIRPTDSRRTAKFILFANSWLQENNIKFDQSIDEKSGDTKWLHISVRNGQGKQRCQFLSIHK